jgi:hypothetical protein
MPNFAIIEVDSGLAVAELEPGMTPDEAAVRQGGVLVDPGPYHTFDDAYDALIALQQEQEEDDEIGP